MARWVWTRQQSRPVGIGLRAPDGCRVPLYGISGASSGVGEAPADTRRVDYPLRGDFVARPELPHFPPLLVPKARSMRQRPCPPVTPGTRTVRRHSFQARPVLAEEPLDWSRGKSSPRWLSSRPWKRLWAMPGCRECKSLRHFRMIIIRLNHPPQPYLNGWTTGLLSRSP
jgi:hypothetical protein